MRWCGNLLQMACILLNAYIRSLTFEALNLCMFLLLEHQDSSFEFTSFMWLLTNNKVLTKDNLAKRRKVEDTSCFFYSEKESVPHLVFDCVVAKQCWFMIFEVINIKV